MSLELTLLRRGHSSPQPPPYEPHLGGDPFERVRDDTGRNSCSAGGASSFELLHFGPKRVSGFEIKINFDKNWKTEWNGKSEIIPNVLLIILLIVRQEVEEACTKCHRKEREGRERRQEREERKVSVTNAYGERKCKQQQQQQIQTATATATARDSSPDCFSRPAIYLPSFPWGN